jgi:hypothetical protein
MGKECKDYVKDSIVCNDEYEAIGYCPLYNKLEEENTEGENENNNIK